MRCEELTERSEGHPLKCGELTERSEGPERSEGFSPLKGWFFPSNDEFSHKME